MNSSKMYELQGLFMTACFKYLSRITGKRQNLHMSIPKSMSNRPRNSHNQLHGNIAARITTTPAPAMYEPSDLHGRRIK
jgi:hypothetical protein